MERKWWTLVVVCGATFMLLLDVTIVVVALPEIQRGLHATFADVQWVIDAYALSLAALLLTAGSLADLYGRRRLFIIGLTVFTLGSLLCGMAQSPLMLIASRTAQGVGGAILFATSLALLAQNFHGRERGVAFGIWGAVTGVATSLGPILGGVITSEINWRGIFLVNVPIGAIAVVVTLWKVEESRLPQADRPDWFGFAALTLALVTLVYGLIRAGEIGWGSSLVIASLALGALFLAVFGIVETRVSHPMFDLSLFRTPTFLGGSIAAFTMNGSLYAMLVYLVLYLQDDLGYSALQTGLRLVLISGGSLIAATLAGRASSFVPVRWLIGPGLFLTGVGLILMAGVRVDSSWTHLIPGFIISGVGSGMVNPPLASTAVGVVEPRRAGMASGVNTTFRQVGIATAIAVLGTIFTNSFVSHLNAALSSVPSLAGKGASLTSTIQQGYASRVIASAPPGVRAPLVGAIRSSFAGTLDELFVVAGILALIGAAFSVLLIRTKDFVPSAPDESVPDSGDRAEMGGSIEEDDRFDRRSPVIDPA
ncbi:MAG: MFS transporter [Acidimicrobiales bacterium]